MLKKILGTFGTRVCCALISFGLLIFNSRQFGPEGVGNIDLFILGVSILQILTSFFGGSSLVYMLPRHDRFQLLFLSYFFGIAVNGLGSVLMIHFKLVPSEYLGQLLLASVCFSLYAVNTSVMLSEERIRLYNLFVLSPWLLLVLSLWIQMYFFHYRDVGCYMNAYTGSYAVLAVLSFCFMRNAPGKHSLKGMGNVLRKMISYGFAIQVANLSQLLNYRLSYYVVDRSMGRAPLGLYGTNTKLCESVWLLPKSVATIQYARISNAGNDRLYAKKVTLAFFKLTLFFSLCCTLLLVLFPAPWIAAVFGSKFAAIKPLMWVSAFGIVLLSGNVILSHYFAGTGNYKVNTTASLLGLGISLLFLIPIYCLQPGSIRFSFSQWVCLATVCSYAGSFSYTLYRFCKETGATWSDFLYRKEDRLRFQEEIHRIFRNQ